MHQNTAEALGLALIGLVLLIMIALGLDLAVDTIAGFELPDTAPAGDGLGARS